MQLVSVIFSPNIPINKSTLASYEVVRHDQLEESHYSPLAGALGSLAFGDTGFLAGYYTKTYGAHLVILNFKDGKRSLAQLSDKLYNALVRIMF